ncbi:Leucine-responsive regulatory protein, regulator for leucine (or lrp) regulon and high-affinity branched-chain amino acid transport system [Marinobacterium lacunae]|uniref:Leucine-responsive regulatory protein, regulator for leucine (Or lrp) regulon and high-affinity branched-chain amino acid transport system n=1 Tax=Marinobacterium lacunae TaxID=1232683 RepID=A0A081FYC7_9GAMM|nr:Lrp/AsnC family transcriptional regulator [Marinobacterium lacunae]KEA63532.1 Leucine-responsive regulatory protein, regulator for leucine (or lrp) regulon and high-affinity branched-chain amino acid transport system [Marinobacterium lacunae]
MTGMRVKLDDRDIQMLSILQREGRITKTELARRVNLSPTPCWERLQHLEKLGVIQGYGARVDWSMISHQTVVFMQAELASHQAADFRGFEQKVQDQPEVLECWALGGGIDYLLKIIAPSVDDYQRFVDRMLNAEIGLKRYYTYIVTKRVKESSAVPDDLLTELKS